MLNVDDWPEVAESACEELHCSAASLVCNEQFMIDSFHHRHLSSRTRLLLSFC